MGKVHKSKKSSKEDLTNNSEIESDIKGKKSKKKTINIKQEPEDITESVVKYENNNDIETKKHKNRHYSSFEKDVNVTNDCEESINISTDDIKKELAPTESTTIDWPEKDMIELFRRMEASIPEKDSLLFSTRVEKLNWEEIAFDNYTGEQCKKIWLLVQKRLRRFRLLNEVLKDAKVWISKPWTDFYKGAKNKKHPDMPRRPLTSYMLYYMKKKDKVQAENPNIELPDISKKIAEMYKALTPNKRQKYDKLAAEKKKEYEEKMTEFHRLHPEFPKQVDKNLGKSNKTSNNEAGLTKPTTPFNKYYKAQLDKEGEKDKASFKEKCKVQWKAMADKKKVVWIDWALEDEAKYNEELKNYLSQNPNYVPLAQKPVLTKEEKLLKERVAGKPTKPPMSAYSLFSRLLMQSEEIKRISAKDRMNYIALQWKGCSEDEKRVYREKVAHMLEQYKLDYASYLESLPEEKRDEELQNNLPKRKAKKADNTEQMPKKRKTKDDIFKNEPAKPPKTALLWFSKSYKGKKTPEESWKSLNKVEQKKYETELDMMKKAYLVEFKKFLESLNKKQLKEFANMRKNRKNSDNEEEEDEPESEEENEAESSECSSEESS